MEDGGCLDFGTAKSRALLYFFCEIEHPFSTDFVLQVTQKTLTGGSSRSKLQTFLDRTSVTVGIR